MAATGRRVLHLVTRDARRGAESAALALHEGLGERGWDSAIVALAPAGGSAPLGVDHLGPAPLALATLRQLRRRSLGADLVVGHGSSTLPAAVLALPPGTPFVYVNIGDVRAWQTSALRRTRSRWFLARARAVVAISPHSAQQLTDVLHVRPSSVTVIPNFRSGERFRPPTATQKALHRQALGLSGARKVVVYLGAMSAEKRPDRAVEAVAGLDAVTLVMVGGGAETARVGAMVDDLGLTGRVRLHGPVEDPRPLLAAADALVLSSDTEGVPGVLIEAGLTGLPVAATDVGFVSDVVVDGVTGRLAREPTGPMLAEALSDALAHPEYGAAARDRCLELFDRAAVLDAWESFLTRQLSGRA